MHVRHCAGLALVAFATAFPAAARGQAIACCNQHITVGGPWIGMTRPENCQEYFNNAPAEIARKMCQQRSALTCLSMERCKEFPPEEIASPPSSSSSAALPSPSDPDRDGLTDGFGGGPPGSAPPAGGPPPRLVYLIKVVPSSGKPVAAFTAWLDRAGCLVPIAANNQPVEKDAAKHVVRGRIVRGDGRLRIEVEASELAGGKLGKRVGEAKGEDAAAVASAMRAALSQMKLACAR